MTEEETTEETPQESAEGTEDEETTFPASYVKELRQEAAEHRVRAQEAGERMDTLRDALRAAVCREASSGILHEPIGWSDDFNDDDGMPDPEKVREAVEKLAAEKPWLSRPRGDVGQGFRGDESDAVSLAQMLRAGA